MCAWLVTKPADPGKRVQNLFCRYRMPKNLRCGQGTTPRRKQAGWVPKPRTAEGRTGGALPPSKFGAPVGSPLD